MNNIEEKLKRARTDRSLFEAVFIKYPGLIRERRFMSAVPRIGDSVILNEQTSTVTKVTWILDSPQRVVEIQIG